MHTRLPQTEALVLGLRHTYGGRSAPVLLGDEPLSRHLYLVGKTGSGKSTLLRNLVLQAVHQGRGLTVIDPHGDLAQELLRHIPPSRVADTIYLDPADRAFPFAYNPLARAGPAEVHLVAGGVVDSLRSVWHDSWGPRLEYILANAVQTLAECGDATLLGVMKLLSDRDYRGRVLQQVGDPALRAFWHLEYERYPARLRQEAIAPVQNKVGRLAAHPVLRPILGQVRSTFDPGRAMEEGRVVIVNLSRGLAGSDATRLLGSLLVAGYGLAVQRRAGEPVTSRRPHLLFIDEFPSFTTTALADMLAGARKYGLALALSHQFMAQLSPALRGAVSGNVGTTVAFSVGAVDAEELSREFGGERPPSAFTELAAFEALVTLSGEGEVPFRARMLPPLSFDYGRSGSIIRRSRSRFTRQGDAVERRIQKYLL